MRVMAWRETLLDCSFRGVVFDVVGTRDSLGRAIAVGEVPYVDGGTVADLGGRPNSIHLKAIFFGDDYEVRLAQLLAVLNKPGPGELVHPVFGVIARAQFVRGDVSHEAGEVDACSVALEFLESGEPAAFFTSAGAEQVQFTVGSLGDSALDAAAGWLTAIVGEIRTALPFAALGELRQSMTVPLLGFMRTVQGVTVGGLDVLDEPRAWARDLASLSNGIIGSANFGANLQADWRAITDVFAGLGRSYGYGSGGTPSSVSPAWNVGSTPTEAQGVAVTQSYLAVNNATAQAEVAAVVLASEVETPTLSPTDIEAVLNSARVEIEAAIMAIRVALPAEQAGAVIGPLKDQALALQEAARAVIEMRPPLVVRTLTAPGNLRLIAHLLYGDHTRAPELARLNNLVSPNALQKGDTIRAFAA